MNRSSTAALVLGCSVLALTLGQACHSIPALCDNEACEPVDGGTTPDGSPSDATTDRDPPPPGCTTPENPLQNPEKCLVDAFGAFVSPTGDDANDGTKAKPFKTIGKALASGKTRVVVCEGTYAEALDIARDVEIYGGVACSFDKAGKHALISPDAPVGLRISAGSLKAFELDVRASAPPTDGGSSVGIFAKTGTTVELSRCVVEAADAKDGVDAAPASNNHFGDPAGNNSSGGTGGPLKTCACPIYGVSASGGGGNGGTAGNPIGTNGSGGSSTPPAPTQGTYTGAGGNGAPNAGTPCNPGLLGSPGTARLSGTGPTRPGTVNENGWSPASGGTGEAGNPGQGGGGGGGAYYLGVNGAGGGGGGCGGCGGAPGLGGGGGGASIGILALDATVRVTSTEIKTGKGGAGKQGGTGQAGGGGGGGTVGACSGAFGGAGAGGGGGGGGAGGLVAGIAYTGVAPQIDTKETAAADVATGMTLGAPGLPGGGGAGGDKATIPVDGFAGAMGASGPAGLAKAVIKVEK